MVRVRRDVSELPERDETLLWYGRAVERMISREDDDPTSWVYFACIHGIPAGMAVPPSGRGVWDQCRHASWFFLPWHRAYLASFEGVVSATVKELGGPEWALPYWNYSDPLAAGAERRLLPVAFRSPRLSDGTANALFAPRAVTADGNAGLSDDRIVSLACLDVPRFATGAAATPDGFGGSDEADPAQSGTGELEAVPHNAVHRRLGGAGGWMGSTATAALDPIFWLHHCFIDRVWEVWRNRVGVSGSPSASRWRNQKFPFPDATGAIVRLAPADVLDTTTLMHGYRYDDVSPAAEPPGGGARLVAGGLSREGRMRGGNDGPVALGTGEMTTVVRMEAPRGLSAFARREPRRALLGVENVTGGGITPDYEVFVERLDGSGAVRVGRLTTFGLTRASSPADRHGGGGLSKTFDVTAALAEIGLASVDAGEFSVRFVPQPLPEATGEPPERLARFAPPRTEGAATVGRVNLYRSAPIPLDDLD